MMANGDGNAFWHNIKNGFDIAMLFENVSWLPHIFKYLPGPRDRLLSFRGIGINRAKARVDAGAKSKDLFYYLSNEDGAEKVSPSRPVVVSDGALAMIAGSDTTATVLASTIWSLLCNPDAYKRLREEVDKFYPAGEDATNPEHYSKMVYLEAVINEALRLYPSVPSGSQRATFRGDGDRVVGNYFIPEGTAVRVHFWSMQRDARNFSHPDTFWPDRWLVAEGLQPKKEGFVHDPNAFVPFSFGPYNCVGKNLALQEMRAVLCLMVQKIEFSFEEGWDPRKYEREMKDKFVMEVGRLPVNVKVRG